MTVLLQATDLVRHYSVRRGWLRPAQTVRALDGVSFTLDAKRTLAIVGESGCGKSTLARQLTMIERPTRGTLAIDGTDVAHADKTTLATLRPRVQMVFQNPYASLNPRQTIAATLAEPLKLNTTLTTSERNERIGAMAARVGLKREHLARYPHMFSGGQRQRIAIARAMMLRPAIVVADEPTSALDVSIQAQILNLFMDLQDEYGTGIVFISHNLAVVEHVAHDVLVMYFGRVVESGAKERVFAEPLHPYTQALMSATPMIRRPQGGGVPPPSPEGSESTRERPFADSRAADRRTRIVIHGEPPSPLAPPPGCAFASRCPRAEARCRNEVPLLRNIGDRQAACHLL